MKKPPYSNLEDKHYSPINIEDNIYEYWLSQAAFKPNPDSDKPRFSVVIPPPNVTGRLHMGHALNNSVQDTLCRYKRMKGFDVLWVPGTDHAGISTQSVVKKHLDAEGIDFYSLGREAAVNKIWEWKNSYGDQILGQLKKLGCSCSWDHVRFTMDEGLSSAVKVAFKKLYDDGLIYRGKYIVNWCPVDKTALSDDEVTTKEGGEPGFIWQIKYKIENTNEYLTVATTRPETIPGDTAIAVNPEDPRYKKLIGLNVHVPLTDRLIPIIADDYADKEFGTGCLKVTPAHDPNDFQIGVRHNLPQINVMNEDGTMGDQAPAQYHGIDRFKFREIIVEELKNLNLLHSVEERMTPVGRAQRSGAVIEYRLSDQWFVQMKPLAKKALLKLDQGDLNIFPERWDSVFRHWLENTRDWCISRQIWWGHQIPAWYNKTTNEILVDIDTPEEVKNNPDSWVQDEDVLDTWFSSALWPYSTMGWPEDTIDLRTYYPTSVLSTAKDIIYFWVARMVMTGVNFLDKVPFKEVYFHPVVCDHKGETMSKSKGNGIDPLHIIEGADVVTLERPIRDARPPQMETMLQELHKNYAEGFSAVGADALRVTLLSLNSQSQQVQLSLKKFDEVGKKFTDKLWNASRFVLSKLTSGETKEINEENLSLEDKWILGRLANTIEGVGAAIESYKFHEGIACFMSFFWDDFCDWYLELTKSSFKDATSNEAILKRSILKKIFFDSLKILHPIAPFITEELWAHAGHANPLCKEAYPEISFKFNKETDEQFLVVREIVRTLRNVRADLGMSAHKAITVAIKPLNEEAKSLINQSIESVIRAANLISLSTVTERPSSFISSVMPNFELYLDLTGAIDINAEIERNKKQIQKLEKEGSSISAKLNNENFIKKAPSEVIEETKNNLLGIESQINRINQVIKELSS